MTDGESTDDGRRWCAGCNHFHGPLYVCPKYSPELRAKIEAQSAAFRDNLRDPAWCAEQQRNGVPDVAIQVMGIFAGVTPGSGRP